MYNTYEVILTTPVSSKHGHEGANISTEDEKQYAEPTQADEVFDIDDIPEMTPEEMEALIEGAELSEDELDKIAGGYRVVGGVNNTPRARSKRTFARSARTPSGCINT